MLFSNLALLALVPAALADWGNLCSSDRKAKVIIGGGPSGLAGELFFNQRAWSDVVTLTGTISGVPPGQHGMHVHQWGDLSQGCNSTGMHWNPLNRNHGAPTDRNRHLGDMGNFEAGADGVIHVDHSDRRMSLCGRYSIMGRAINLHVGTDDLGRGGVELSLQTGNAGPRLACGVIGAVDPST
ncbi:hypothetical protein CcaverHIS002_0600170 [Cutaneotrichosporon cavernicola]|uniref:Superoxide dismutase [Cu-Zn] n=1 Tax=Cutaneotrichosporon cavernicola TaxID=279322 RepID=A0AA48L5Q1_9TREE|nr:uncharacterized protein CcaverHIS019_0500260 [Cutaneotrichosporon cavernicola]BEI85730.1 hypothetical protein CcaverHIS002_0600170 [Cutaneotrichosporon cavernicola]BEI92398.1 hypothetical protein CcaverHIS019_0500260 [Cutaneotrichosporon cavernicola]BEJ00171.1 hypothetical protein CcaverHIS631_0500280 [Cutaneotrichosporon cavernicola]BEJ07942.1 hypothetical protein CcaverHIS641_0500270 [Cutaneotrichosporon cavernicola]